MTYRPSELFNLLNGNNLRPKKGLSQNFLIDGNIIKKILSAAEVEKDDIVIEIGPGPGALTQALLNAGCCVIAIEKDGGFAAALKRLQTEDNRLSVLHADALECEFEKFLQKGKKAKVVANLPYHITTPIIARLLPMQAAVKSLTLMVQKEVAKRFTAEKKSADYSSISVFTRYYSRPHYCFTVQPTCFYPRPKVQSAVVRFDLQTPPLATGTDKFFTLTRSAFQKRRKMLRNSLKDLYDPSQLEQAFLKLNLSPCCRPEELSLEEFLALFNSLNKA